jgi:hypothetical protein
VLDLVEPPSGAAAAYRQSQAAARSVAVRPVSEQARTPLLREVEPKKLGQSRSVSPCVVR